VNKDVDDEVKGVVLPLGVPIVDTE